MTAYVTTGEAEMPKKSLLGNVASHLHCSTYGDRLEPNMKTQTSRDHEKLFFFFSGISMCPPTVLIALHSVGIIWRRDGNAVNEQVEEEGAVKAVMRRCWRRAAVPPSAQSKPSGRLPASRQPTSPILPALPSALKGALVIVINM